MNATPTSEFTKDFRLLWRSAKEQSQTSIESSEQTVLERDRKPEKQVWLNRAEQLKTIILSDIEIKKRQKEPYKGFNPKKEVELEGQTERTIKADPKLRDNMSTDQPLSDGKVDVKSIHAPAGKIREEAIYEDHYD